MFLMALRRAAFTPGDHAIGVAKMSVSRLGCFVVGHRWVRVRYDGADMPDGFFLRRRRCATETHKDSSGMNGALAWGFRPF